MGRRSRGAERDARGDGDGDGDGNGQGGNSESAGGPRLPWGLGAAEMQPSSLAALTDDKLARFVIGQQKKTKFEKEREEREARKRQADAEAAEIYAKFVASFDNEDDKLGKLFVRAQAPGSSSSSTATQPPASSSYRLKPKEMPVASVFAAAAAEPSVVQAPPKRMTEMDRMLEEMKQKDAERQQKWEQSSATHPPKKRRAIDDFLEEMKERGPAGAYVDDDGHSLSKGSYDSGDPETTNLYVGNLAPTVTEEVLEREFGKYGQIYSIKIMWPRSEEERARRRNCGFVSFFARKDADSARVSLHDKELEGQPMIVGWGKAVKIDHSARAPGILLPPTQAAAPVLPTPAPVAAGMLEKKRIKVEFPTDEETRSVVDRLAKYVAADGLQFENAIRLRETANHSYRFLFERDSSLAVYYRWRVYAFAMGDDNHEWREEPFQMTVDGPIWVPPPVPPRPASRRRSRSRSPSSRRITRERHSNDSPQRKRRRSSSRSSSRNRSRSRRRSRSSGRNHSRSRSTHRSSKDDHRGRRERSYSSDSSYSSSSDGHKRGRRSRSRSRSHGRRRSRSDSRSRSRSHSRSRSPSWSRDNGRHSRQRQQTEVVQLDKLATGQQIARARDIERGREPNRLSEDDHEAFQELLAELTLERESVKEVMGFALDNSEAAVDIVHTLREAFHRRKDSSAVALVGFLFVASDILHNSSAAVKNASLFRTTFQDCLPEIMDVLRVAHKNILGRMSANAMKEKVLSVLTAWESWSLFPPGYLVGLNATFMRKVEEADFMASHGTLLEQVSDSDEERLRKMCKQAGILSSGSAKDLFGRLQWLKEFTAPVPAGSAASRPAAMSTSAPRRASPDIASASVSVPSVKPEVNAEDVDGEPMDDEDLDGEPMGNDGDLDGEPMDDGDDTSVVEAGSRAKTSTNQAVADDDIDGVPLDEDNNDEDPRQAEEDIDGVPIDDGELDGEPIDDDELDGVPLDEDLDGEPI